MAEILGTKPWLQFRVIRLSGSSLYRRTADLNVYLTASAFGPLTLVLGRQWSARKVKLWNHASFTVAFPVFRKAIHQIPR